MNAAVQIQIAAEGSAGVGNAKAPALPGCEIATDASGAESGSNAEMIGSWKELLKAVGLMPQASTAPAAGSNNAAPQLMVGPEPGHDEVLVAAGSASEGAPQGGASKAVRLGPGLGGRLAAFAAGAGSSGRMRKEHAGSLSIERADGGAATAKQSEANAVESAAFLAVAPVPASIVAGMELPIDIPAPVAALPVVPSGSSNSAPFEMDFLSTQNVRDAQQTALELSSTHDVAGKKSPHESGIATNPAPMVRADAETASLRPAEVVAEESVGGTDRMRRGAPGANLNVPATSESMHTVPGAREPGDGFSAQVAEARDTIRDASAGENSQSTRPAVPGADSEGTNRSLRSSMRARVSGAVHERSARIAVDHPADTAGPLQRSPIFDAGQLNAPALREIGGLASTGERQAGAPHQAGAAAGDPFAALDETRATPPAWIHAGTHRAEAGYLDPALGWIGIRADAAGNGVHAALVPGSVEAAQVLGSHVAGLNAYLSEHHREATTVTMAAPQEGREGMGTGSGSGDRSSAHQEQPQSGERRNEGPAVAVFDREPVAAVGTAAVRAAESAAKYISVMA